MKKAMYQFMMVFAVMCIGVNGWAAPPATDVQCNPLGCVNDTDIATDAVTEMKIAAGAVTNTKIADGAVTDAKITGPISASKLEKPANMVVVAMSGGDYTSISAALAAITPSSTNPYIIRVMPGTYTDNITMKSYVHLQGSGAGVTTIESGNSNLPVIKNDNVTHAKVSGLTVSGGTLGSQAAFKGSSATLIAEDNVIIGYHDSGFELAGYSDVTIINNAISGTRYGIVFGTNDKCKVIGNRIFDNTRVGIYFGGSDDDIIKDNEIVNNYSGIEVYSASPTIIQNKITGNTSADVSVPSTANFGYNIFDVPNPASARGVYNINSNNVPW